MAGPPAPEPTLTVDSPMPIGWSELRFGAMGTQVHLAALAEDPTLLMEARRRIDELEERWSRFRPDSVVSRINRAEGRPLMVDEETFDLLTTAVGAWHGTGHRFDPTVLDALVQSGYDRTFDQIGAGPSPAPGPAPRPAPGCDGIALEPELSRVTLPAGVHLDLGGIGKGRTADLVATELVGQGARSTLVNLGGDLRIAGALPAGNAFSIAIEDPADLSRPATAVRLGVGALATSSRARRRWSVGGEERHHLIDPATGRAAEAGVDAVTVIAGDATRAEVLAKAALIAGLDAGTDLLTDADVPALLIAENGSRRRLGGFEAYEETE